MNNDLWLVLRLNLVVRPLAFISIAFSPRVETRVGLAFALIWRCPYDKFAWNIVRSYWPDSLSRSLRSWPHANRKDVPFTFTHKAHQVAQHFVMFVLRRCLDDLLLWMHIVCWRLATSHLLHLLKLPHFDPTLRQLNALAVVALEWTCSDDLLFRIHGKESCADFQNWVCLLARDFFWQANCCILQMLFFTCRCVIVFRTTSKINANVSITQVFFVVFILLLLIQIIDFGFKHLSSYHCLNFLIAFCKILRWENTWFSHRVLNLHLTLFIMHDRRWW